VQRANVSTKPEADRAEENAAAAAARAGDEGAFAGLARRYRYELQLHCYRMLGSYDDSEDMVHETFLRAWRRRETYQPASAFRTWLYRVATGACLDFLDHWPHTRRPASRADIAAPPAALISWVQPYPDTLLDAIAPDGEQPGVPKATIDLAFLTALQHLPPRQRAVLIMRDVLGRPAKETAVVLEASVASVNSALQRARPTLRRHLPEGRPARPYAEDAGDPEDTGGTAERAVLERFMAAVERADDAALARLLAEDARAGRQPGAGGYDGTEPAYAEGRDAILAAWTPALRGPCSPEFRFLPAYANRQPAAAAYARTRGGGEEFRPFALTVLRVENGMVRDLSSFSADLFPAFGLPAAV
jgi:RNA polymerase sigma-70 factor (ECF subfamily)